MNIDIHRLFNRLLAFSLAILVAALFMLPFLMIEQSLGRQEVIRKLQRSQRAK